ncbi:MAG: DUF1801 domain-containing protein [Flavobacteriales bacterium]|jgi:hypothetical protein|nr:DUF1801 domain-containing protein [Flavobacteriales bacterium]MCB0758976.1 DUF1801 domain-containing protein [Flavobacteriales bacterium]
MSTDQEPFEQAIATYSEPIKALARQVRAFIHDILPGVVEVVWVHQKTVGYGTGPKKNTEHFSWLLFTKNHVNLGFNYGAELPDPDKLLEGTGKLFRHVKIRNAEQLKDPALRALVRFATTYRVPALKRG